MELLISGLTLWTLVHFIPSLAQPIKKKWVAKLGEKYYALTFAIIVLISLALIIFGWRSSSPEPLYFLPMFTKQIALALIFVAFILFGAAQRPSRIKQFIRHPQLLGLIFWCSAHLILNGDTRSVLLFGWLGCWAILEIIFINGREGAWVKGANPSWVAEVRGLVISLVILAVVAAIHPYLAGVPIR